MKVDYQTVDFLTNTIIVVGAVLNILLLYLIRNFSKNEIGSYAHLLTMFATYDVVLILINYLLTPRAIPLPYMLAVILEVAYGSKMLTCFHSISFLVSYAILTTHFLYRYWLITRPSMIFWFSSTRFYVVWMLVVTLFLLFLILITTHITSSGDSEGARDALVVYHSNFGGDNRRGWVVFDYKKGEHCNIPVVLLTLFYDYVGSAMLTAVTVLAWLTYRRIAVALTLSPQKRNFQLRLLATACIQTLIPVMFVSLPFFCNMNIPLLGYTLSTIADISGLLIALFPVLDPLALILLLKPYREGVISMFWKSSRIVFPTVPMSESSTK